MDIIHTMATAAGPVARRLSETFLRRFITVFLLPLCAGDLPYHALERFFVQIRAKATRSLGELRVLIQERKVE